MTNPLRVPFILLALLMLPPAASAAPDQSSAGCSPMGTKTLAANSQVRIYQGTAPRSGQDNPAPVYGCLKSSGKSTRLGPIERKGWSTSMGSPFALKATWAGAVENRRPGQDATRVYVTSRDVRKGKGRRCLIGSADQAGRPPAVRFLLIDKAGALAWAAITPSPTGRAPLIGACDSQGGRVLDSGAGVEINSVELHGSTLFWSNAGGLRSANLH